ncbi:MAG: hypothetical protein PHW53_02970 [Patescibacteria group bacterium]|nr:hypothetical protein [Patescibacteria group bacterium]
MNDNDSENQNQPAAQKQEIILRILKQVRESVDALISVVEAGSEAPLADLERFASQAVLPTEASETAEGGRVIEGVFNGEQMVGSDGREYMVPANYASKSKLVEGDILKLTVTGQGNFIYKQIGPIERQRVVGALVYEKEKDEYFVTSDRKTWRVLPASVTYFKGQAGDEAVILVPKDAPSSWAAVENIIRK